MKAYLVSKYKSPMQAGEVAEPTVGDRDVLVDIHAAGVNMLDAKIRDGEFKLLIPYQAPFLLGHDVAGVVARVGSAVRRVTVGDEVYARPRDGRIGTFAERIAVDEDDLAIKPANLSMAEAASVPPGIRRRWPRLLHARNDRAGVPRRPPGRPPASPPQARAPSATRSNLRIAGKGSTLPDSNRRPLPTVRRGRNPRDLA